jgi:TolA-binding protein
LKTNLKGNPMKKTFLFALLIFALALTACSGTASADQASSTQASAALPTATQLVIGTLKLEGTEQAVTSEQAKDLLVMWQVYQDLNSSDTAAQEEIDGLVEQIQETMTSEHMKAISAMNLTQQDIFALMQEQGVGMGQVRQSSSSNNSNSTQSGGGFTPPDGGMAGGPPDGGGMPGGAPPDGGIGGIGASGSSTSTGQAQNTGAGSGAGGTAGISTALVGALIQYLEQIASA